VELQAPKSDSVSAITNEMENNMDFFIEYLLYDIEIFISDN